MGARGDAPSPYVVDLPTLCDTTGAGQLDTPEPQVTDGDTSTSYATTTGADRWTCGIETPANRSISADKILFSQNQQNGCGLGSFEATVYGYNGDPQTWSAAASSVLSAQGALASSRTISGSLNDNGGAYQWLVYDITFRPTSFSENTCWDLSVSDIVETGSSVGTPQAAEENQPSVTSTCYTASSLVNADGSINQSWSLPDGTSLTSLYPPPGWQPASATDAELAKYGFPPRPSDAQGLADWNSQYATTAWTFPQPSAICDSDGSAGYSPNWANWQTTQSRGFSRADGTSTIPPTKVACPHASNFSGWVGFGGQGNTTLTQDGWVSDYTASDFHVYNLFWEQYPAENAQLVKGFNLNEGDSIYSSVTHYSSSDQYSWINHTRGWSWNTSEPLRQGWTNTPVEYVVERFKVNGVLQNLRTFTSPVKVTSAHGDGIAINTLSPTSNRMTSNGLSSGTLLAAPSAIGSGGAFSVTHYNCT